MNIFRGFVAGNMIFGARFVVSQLLLKKNEYVFFFSSNKLSFTILNAKIDQRDRLDQFSTTAQRKRLGLWA